MPRQPENRDFLPEMNCLGHLLAAFIFSLVLAAERPAYCAKKIKHTSLEPQGLDQAIDEATNYLMRVCQPNGRFVYEIDANTGETASTYNIVRHEGAIYALGMAKQPHGSFPEDQAIDRASKFLTAFYVGPGIAPDLSVVWTRPIPDRSAAELGAAGLGLVALTTAERAKPGSVSQEELEAIGRFGLFLQRKDGSFVSKYNAQSGPVEDFDSLYYPGEMALGFLYLYEEDPKKIWLDAAIKALTYLALSRSSLDSVPPDHWSMIATAKLFELCGREKMACSFSHDQLIHHAEQVSKALMSEQQIDSPIPQLIGSFGLSGRTTPTAIRLEGLLAALEFLPESPLKAQLRFAVPLGIKFLLEAFIRSGSYAGGMPRSVLTSTPGASEIRIDYVQHALCALIRYRQFSEGSPAASGIE